MNSPVVPTSDKQQDINGDSNTISSNQTTTNISENTTTSDSNARKIFKTA